MKKITRFAFAMVLSFLFMGSSINKPTIRFLESLNEDQRSKLMKPMDDTSRNFWHFLPAKMLPRTGLRIDELNDGQKVEFSHMLQSFLSESGYEKTQEIIELENVLIELGGDPDFRDDGAYFIAIYGDPKTDSVWAWSFEGHHVSLNFTVSEDKISTTPRFFGANPATIPAGSRKGERTLHREEDMAFELLNSLSEQQKKAVVFQKASFEDIVTTNAIEVAPLRPVGIEAGKLNAEQKIRLKELIRQYLSSIPEDLAQERARKIEKEEFDKIRFAWAGALTKGKGHYYRIQGKTFLIEFDNTQNNANHIHTVWRDFDGDFGRDLIREHYLNSNHHKKK